MLRGGLNLLLLAYLALVLCWRKLLTYRFVQQRLHEFGSEVAFLLQWHVFLFGLVAVIALWTLYSVLFDLLLTEEQVLTSLGQVYEAEVRAGTVNQTFTEFQEGVMIPTWLQGVNLASQFAAFLTCLVVGFQTYAKFVFPAATIERRDNGLDAEWMLPRRINWLLVVLTVPALSAAMSMHASIRLWSLITGTAAIDTWEEWHATTASEVALFSTNIEVARLYQLYAVYCFTRICGSFLNQGLVEGLGTGEDHSEVAKEYCRVIRSSGFLAIWTFVIVGTIRSWVELFLSIFLYNDPDRNLGVFSFALEDFGTVFSFLTILCVINMFMIAQVSSITYRLGNANIKFQGARMILLTLEVQSKIIRMLTAGTVFNETLRVQQDSLGFRFRLPTFTYFEAPFLHFSLLNFECLVAAVINLIAWKDFDVEDARTLVERMGLRDYEEEEVLYV